MEGVVSLRRYQFSLRPYPDLIFFPGGTSVRDTCSFPVSKRPEAEVSHRKAHPFPVARARAADAHGEPGEFLWRVLKQARENLGGGKKSMASMVGHSYIEARIA